MELNIEIVELSILANKIYIQPLVNFKYIYM